MLIEENNKQNNKEDNNTNDNNNKNDNDNDKINSNNPDSNIEKKQNYKDRFNEEEDISYNCSDGTKIILKIIFFPFYCFYFFFELIRGERWDPYYESIFFKENILFSILSIIDLFVIGFNFSKLNSGFFIIRTISDSFGFLNFFLSIVCWSEYASDEDHFDPACFCCTNITLPIIGILDLTSLILYFIYFSELNIIVIISFLVHLILVIGFTIYDFKMYLCR